MQFSTWIGIHQGPERGGYSEYAHKLIILVRKAGLLRHKKHMIQKVAQA